MTIRPYNAERDAKAVRRIWREVHWINSDDEEQMMDHFLAVVRAFVVELNGEAECLATSVSGTFRYLNEDLCLSAITGVTTSRVARKQGFAGRLTAERIAADVVEGAEICVLSMFEQGFYDRLGFGTGPYEHKVRFDPADLMIDRPFRVPKRLTSDDWKAVHAGLLDRFLSHGACSLAPPRLIQAELGWPNGGFFGLGYDDGPDGALTHFFWARGKEECGPYYLKFFVYQTYDQLLELLALLKSLGDQIRLVSLIEPPEIQLQDLIKQPFRGQMVTHKTGYEQHCRASAYWQARICNLEACLAKTHLTGSLVRFNLSLHDPISDLLDADTPWHGISGQYVVTLGPESSAEPGIDEHLPTLTASVGAFTRLWLGVRPATGLAVTDDLDGLPELLSALDEILRLPVPNIGWEF